MKINIMKHKTFLLILLGWFLISSCSNKTAPIKNKEELKQPSVGDAIPSEVATEVFDKATITKKGVPQMEEEEDCHGKRLVSQTFEEVDAFILKVGGNYVISMDNGNSRYNPCEIADKYKVDGMMVRVTGESLEIFPGERLIATPFRLSNIAERDK